MSTKILKIILGALLLLVLLLALTFFTAPDGSEFKTKNPSTTALIQRRTKEYRQAGKNIPIRWKWMPLKRISPYLIHATIIAEDSRFYEHAGVDPEALRFALKKNLVRKRYAIGGSTITQQLARNLYLTPRKSLVRKFKEIIIAYKMERKLSKRRILELYLNVIELGRGIYGVEAASRYYFGKAADQLSVTEAIQLVSIYPSPRRHFPGDDTKFTARRYRRILTWLFQTGRIDSLTYLGLSGIKDSTLSDFSDSTETFAPDILNDEMEETAILDTLN